jgi:hypothetical protein
MNKYIVNILNIDGSINRTVEFKNMKDISKKFSITYHQIRGILDDEYKNKKFIHSYCAELIKKMQIKTNPELLNKITLLDESIFNL